MRDPVDLFASAWNYYGLAKIYNMSLEEFARRDTSDFMQFRVADERRLHMAKIQFDRVNNEPPPNKSFLFSLDASRSRSGEGRLRRRKAIERNDSFSRKALQHR